MFLTVQPQHNFIRAANELLDILNNTPGGYDPLTYRYGLDPRRRSIRVELNDQDHILTTVQFNDLYTWAQKYT